MKTHMICLVLLLNASIAAGQQSDQPSPQMKPPVQQKLSGPRLGLTLITGSAVDSLKERFDANPLITQFGWQFERRFMAMENGLAGLAETVILIGGIEQEIFLPSLSFLVGLRTPAGTEFGLGPNLSITGVAYVFAVGVTKRYGDLNFPINFSVVSSKEGARFSLLFGFNMVTK